MKNSVIIALLVSTFSWSAFAADAPSKEGIHNESEAGIVTTGGNSESQSFNLKQSNTYGWDKNLGTFNARFLKTSAKGVETAKSWSFGFRYDRALETQFSLFVGLGLESDPFAGFQQRYNIDLGGKYTLMNDKEWTWSAEGGYRYTIENRLAGQSKASYLRAYSEATRTWTETFSTKLWLEYLPNLSVSSDYQLNSELSGSAAISSIFSIKMAYLLKYRHLLIAPATQTTDTQFTTALVAKF